MRQARDLIRPVLEGAAEPLATTQIAELSGGWQVSVYFALCSLERDGEVVRAGRVGSSARAEVLWRAIGVEIDEAPSSGPADPTSTGIPAADTTSTRWEHR